MYERAILDWDDAYANMPNIANGENYPARWEQEAAAFREEIKEAGRLEAGVAYGDGERQRYDLFQPDGGSHELAVIVHGGYWMRFDRSYFSHLARGALERGWAVAMPSYSLCPEVSIEAITGEIAAAIASAAGRFKGRLRLVGHSAGGHLVTRMVCRDTPLDPQIRSRIDTVMSISGVHDLRPLLRLDLNETLRLDADAAAKASPALHEPVNGMRLICWVGAGERAEFLRQNALLANLWLGLGARTSCVEEPDRHHFDVIEGLEDPNSQMVKALLG